MSGTLTDDALVFVGSRDTFAAAAPLSLSGLSQRMLLKCMPIQMPLTCQCSMLGTPEMAGCLC